MCIHWVRCIAMKDVGLRIRVQRDLRERFLEVYRAPDKPAAQTIHEFMREYVAPLDEQASGQRGKEASLPAGPSRYAAQPSGD